MLANVTPRGSRLCSSAPALEDDNNIDAIWASAGESSDIQSSGLQRMWPRNATQGLESVAHLTNLAAEDRIDRHCAQFKSILGTIPVLVFFVMVPLVKFAYSQEYPNKPIRIITSEAGGGSDFAARLIAQGLSGPLGRPLIVDNRAGGGITIAEHLIRAVPDGYTILVTGINVWLDPLFRKASYDSIDDFAPISLLATTPSILVTHPTVPAKSVSELIALAKAKAGQLNYAAGAKGSSSHLWGEQFKSMAGMNMVAITYKSAGQAIKRFIGGQVQMNDHSAGGVVPHVKSGEIAGLGCYQRSPITVGTRTPTVGHHRYPVT